MKSDVNRAKKNYFEATCKMRSAECGVVDGYHGAIRYSPGGASAFSA